MGQRAVQPEAQIVGFGVRCGRVGGSRVEIHQDVVAVPAPIGLAEAFGLELVAEGVESPAAAATLLQHGCHRAQGYLLSRPLQADAMAALFAKKAVPVDFSGSSDT